MIEIRDPIHGAIRSSPSEGAVVGVPFVQRLRNVHATGFSYLPFPGATHSRYAHSLGVMHLAGLAFDSVFEGWSFSGQVVRERLRAVVRLAALCHDLGHSPFSHCTEWAMPPLAALGIQSYRSAADLEDKATHEDYTVAMLEHPSLTQVVGRHFSFTTRHVAALISPEVAVTDGFFTDAGLDMRPVLSQMVSSELDVDRLDYLVRDSYYSGARYGQIDVSWLLSNLATHVVDDQVNLALDERAIYAFDDFMIARHHMFLMVYFHHKSVVYEEMLKRWVTSSHTTWQLPANLDDYATWDDIRLLQHLRDDRNNDWAQRIVSQRPYRRVLERHGSPKEVDLSQAAAVLEREGIPCLQVDSTGRLSRYALHGTGRTQGRPIYVLPRPLSGGAPAVKTLDKATEIFTRYADARRIARIYTCERDREAAKKLLAD